MSEESKEEVRVHAIGRLKISATQAGIVEDYSSIRGADLLGKMISYAN